MKSRVLLFSLILMSFSLVAAAADLGAHIGYYDNDVKKPYIGVNLSFPVGPVSIVPNVDYWKDHGVGYWLGGGDVVLRFNNGGTGYWVGAGPTYGYLTSYGSGSSYGTRARTFQYTPPSTGNPGNPGTPPVSSPALGGPFGNGKDNAWGWDVNGGITFGTMAHGLRPYITGRYNKVKDLKAGGVAIGLRFGL